MRANAEFSDLRRSIMTHDKVAAAMFGCGGGGHLHWSDSKRQQSG